METRQAASRRDMRASPSGTASVAVEKRRRNIERARATRPRHLGGKMVVGAVTWCAMNATLQPVPGANDVVERVSHTHWSARKPCRAHCCI